MSEDKNEKLGCGWIALIIVSWGIIGLITAAYFASVYMGSTQ